MSTILRNLSQRGTAVPVSFTVAALLLAGCGRNANQDTAPAPTPVSAAKITVTPDNPRNPKKTAFNTPITVTATNGTLTAVTVTGPNGPVAGEMNTDRTKWRSTVKILKTNSRYKTTATAADNNGVPVTVLDSFKTITPKGFAKITAATTSNGRTYGTGMPISFTFNHSVKNRKAVTQRFRITANHSFVGSWKWSNNNKTITFRPKKPYPRYTNITVKAKMKGMNFGNGIYGNENVKQEFKIGSAFVMNVNAKTHRMKVYKNGKLIRTIPITTGKPGYETRSGVKVIMSKEETTVMTAPGRSPGDPEYYRLNVDKAMRVTWSGEYIHAAPWSTGSQGNDNVSHGCIGMSDANAAWLYSQAKVGDIVTVTGTPAQQNLGNGWTDWNIPWKTWVKQSTGGTTTT